MSLRSVSKIVLQEANWLFFATVLICLAKPLQVIELGLEPKSNRHARFTVVTDFKSIVPTNFATRAPIKNVT